jgi:hypothetical protein
MDISAFRDRVLKAVIYRNTGKGYDATVCRTSIETERDDYRIQNATPEISKA